VDCEVAGVDRWCRRCGCEGAVRDSVTRRLAHEPFGWRPSILVVTVRRYRCEPYGHVWRQDTTSARLSRGALPWALEALVVGHLSVARVAAALAVSWNTESDAVIAEGHRVLIADPGRFDGVRVLEHVWRHTRHGDKYVTVIIDLTPVRGGTGPARLLDMAEGRSRQVFKTRLAGRPQAWRDQVEVVAMDGLTGFRTAAAEEVPDAVAVIDPFHVVRLAGDAFDRYRRRVQQQLHGHRSRRGDPPYAARQTLHNGADLLTNREQVRLDTIFAGDTHVEGRGHLGCVPGHGRRLPPRRPPAGTPADGEPDRLAHHGCSRRPHRGRHDRTDPEEALRERACLLRRPGTSNGPTEAINGRLEHLAAPPSAYGTSPTTSPDHSSRPEDSDPGYTLHCEEPLCLLRSV